MQILLLCFLFLPCLYAFPAVQIPLQVGTSCPGYRVTSVDRNASGLKALLHLNGPSCHQYGRDLAELSLEVTCETAHRLHVHILNIAPSRYHFQIPSDTLPRSKGTSSVCDLSFDYNQAPFTFWITNKLSGEIIFDTRGQPSMIFEEGYLQIGSSLPTGANVYGLGEVMYPSGFRLNENDTIATMWASSGDFKQTRNAYGAHPTYMEHRINAEKNSSSGHAVTLMNSHGMDVVLRKGSIEYRVLGGTLDFYFVTADSPTEVISEAVKVVGLPTIQAYWTLGFQICRWGYHTINDTIEVIRRMREANIPLETQWLDIDFMHDYKDFTVDPIKFPASEMTALTQQLHANHQYIVPIIDAGIPVPDPQDSLSPYGPYTTGKQQDLWVKQKNGEDYVGKVWAGKTVFPDWLAANTSNWWAEHLQDLNKMFGSDIGEGFDGIWLDMNEATAVIEMQHDLVPRPGYQIHAFGGIEYKVMPIDAIHAGDVEEQHVHNLFGHSEGIATYKAIEAMQPKKRPFLLSRSTFLGSGRTVAHWLGDNWSTWRDLKASIPGVLSFQLFGIPMVGPDTCGFNADASEELCARWMAFGAFLPFYRNHNTFNSTAQEPYVWTSVAEASRRAISIRYRLLPYIYTLLADASLTGRPMIRALWQEFPNDPTLLDVDSQIMLGPALLVTPVLEPNVSAVTGYFPSHEPWRDWYTHEVIETNAGRAQLDAPLEHINVHIRSGSILLMHSESGYTTHETRQFPYTLLIALDSTGRASGTAYVDDGISPNALWDRQQHRRIHFQACDNHLRIQTEGAYHVERFVETVVILGTSKMTLQVDFSLNTDSTLYW